MFKKMSAIAAVLAVMVVSGAAPAGDRVGLGASIGTVFPNDDRDINWSDVGLNWGFWVDIPIAWVFHLTPSAEIYDLGGEVGKNTATDICLNFKFIVPLSFMHFFFGVAGGVTNHDDYNPNAGVLAGLSLPLVSNLEAFVQAKYKILIADPNVHVIHANAGMLFLF